MLGKLIKDKWKAFWELASTREGFKLLIETLTLAAVVFYGAVAYRQWRETQKYVRQEVMINRPVVFGYDIHATSYGGDGAPLAVKVIAKNWGKSTRRRLVLL
jgi:hypothetical protein